MSDVVEVIEDVVNVSIDETHIEVVSVGTQGPPGPTGDPATNLVTSVVGETGDVTLEMMGLDLVDNTPDVDKPVSTSQQAALDAKVDQVIGNTRVYVTNGSGAQTSNAWSDAPNADTFARRTTGGQTRVGTAVLSDAATTKAQMDAADATKFDKTGGTISGGTLVQYAGDVNFGIQSTTPTTGKRYNLISAGAGNFGIQDVTGVKTPFRITTDAPNLALDITSSGLNIQGKGVLYGTGFPNGVVSALVGSIYIDTAVTNGASSWIKKSGTGNTGWSVLEGNTGWRNVTHLLLNGWTGFFGASVLILRDGNNTYIKLDGIKTAATTANTFINMPAGFRTSGANSRFALHSLGAQPSSMYRGYFTSGGDGLVTAVTSSFGDLFGELSYATTEAWPTTLPGTAA